MSLRHAAKSAAAVWPPHVPHLARAWWRSVRPPTAPVPLDTSLAGAYNWLCRAQDARPDGGVAAWFDLRTGRWSASYPETTGYIAPTFLAYAEALGSDEARTRALRMASWGIDVQLPDGAVVSGLYDPGLVAGPAVFNTGQAIFGWVTAFEATGEERYADAAARAARWLVERMDDDGAWAGNLSAKTTASLHTFNTRTAWALARASLTLGEPSLCAAAVANCTWALTMQDDAGWFRCNAFSDTELPLLHTVVYAIEGLIGTYVVSDDGALLVGAERAVDGLMAARARDGRLAGRYGARFASAASWRCLTGESQLAVVLQRLARIRSVRGQYRHAAGEMLELVARTQYPAYGDDDCAGGIAGAWPMWGDYSRFQLLSWAAKFQLDGVLGALYDVDEPSLRMASPSRLESPSNGAAPPVDAAQGPHGA